MICHSQKPHPNLLRKTDPATPSRKAAPEQLERAATPIRMERVIRVKRQLQMGTYDEGAKIDALLDRLVADVLAHDESSTDDAAADRPAAEASANEAS